MTIREEIKQKHLNKLSREYDNSLDPLTRYMIKFNEYPPMIQTVDLSNKLYTDLLEHAINRNEPLTWQEINVYFDELQYDYAYETEEQKYAKGMRRRMGEED